MNTLKSTILKEFYFSGTQSIAEISESIGKSIPLVTKTIQELIDENLVKITGLRASTGGRRATNYTLEPNNHKYVIAIAIDQKSLDMVVYDILNEPIYSLKHSDISDFIDNDIYKLLCDNITEILKNIDRYKISGIGITTPGFVDLKNDVNNSFDNKSPLYDLRKRIHKEFSIPTFLENDSSAIAMAEKYFGKAKNAQNALIINLTWGVGLGMIVQNQLFRGERGFAGEFSHIPLSDENKLCSCGKKGCLEVEASLNSAIEYITNEIRNGEVSRLSEILNVNGSLKFEDVLQAYENGDQLTIKAVKKIAHMLGKGIATLIHILDPEKIIVSGKGSVFGSVLLPEIQSAIQEYCIPRLSDHTKIEISNLKEIQLKASACIAIQQMQWR